MSGCVILCSSKVGINGLTSLPLLILIGLKSTLYGRVIDPGYIYLLIICGISILQIFATLTTLAAPTTMLQTLLQTCKLLYLCSTDFIPPTLLNCIFAHFDSWPRLWIDWNFINNNLVYNTNFQTGLFLFIQPVHLRCVNSRTHSASMEYHFSYLQVIYCLRFA